MFLLEFQWKNSWTKDPNIVEEGERSSRQLRYQGINFQEHTFWKVLGRADSFAGKLLSRKQQVVTYSWTVLADYFRLCACRIRTQKPWTRGGCPRKLELVNHSYFWGNSITRGVCEKSDRFLRIFNRQPTWLFFKLLNSRLLSNNAVKNNVISSVSNTKYVPYCYLNFENSLLTPLLRNLFPRLTDYWLVLLPLTDAWPCGWPYTHLFYLQTSLM